MNKSNDSNSTTRITLDMLENALRGVGNEMSAEASGALAKLAYAIGAGLVLFAGLAYMAGRRVGRQKSTIVEIKRS